MVVKIGKVIGKLGGVMWGQVHEFWPDEEEAQIKKGRLVIAVEIEVAADQNPAEVGHEMLFRINEMYYGSEHSAWEALQKTLQGLSEEFVGVKAILFVSLGDVVYVGSNNGRVWTEKGDKSGWLINLEEVVESEIDTQEDEGEIKNENKFVSGRMGGGERFVLGTDEFWNKLVISEVKKGEDSLQVETEKLVAKLHKGVGGVGAVIEVDLEKKGVAKKHDDKNVEEASEALEDKAVEMEEIEDEEVEERMEVRREMFGAPKLPLKERVLGILNTIKGQLKMDDIYVVEQPKESYRKIVLTGVVVLILFTVVFVAGRIKNQSVALKNDSGEKQIELLVHQYNEAKGLVGMNRDRSKELLSEVSTGIASLNEKQMEDTRIKNIQADMGEVLGMASGTLKIVLKQVVDLGLVREGAAASKLVLLENSAMAVLDIEGKRIFNVKINTGAVEVMAGKEAIGEAKLMASYPEKVVVLSDKGVVECKVAEKKCDIVIASEETMNEARDVKMWAGNVYTLLGNRILKYPVIEDGYGAAQNWIAKDEVGVLGATSFQIDGNVWVSEEAGSGSSKISKYVGGLKEEFAVTGLDKALGANVTVETSEGLENLFILDRDNKRVLVIKKTGEFVEQWTSEELGSVNSMVVDEASKKVYFAKGSGVYFYEGN